MLDKSFQNPADYNPSAQIAVPMAEFSFTELADIYNQTRVDYIVPMPMNAQHLEAYVAYYSIDLDASFITYNGRHPSGLGMLGIRNQRAWVTRFGVIPQCRGHHVGSFLMQTLLDTARKYNVQRLQLEVIKGNDPALNLFQKYGFAPTRELFILRRPPIPVTDYTPLPHATLTPLSQAEILAHLSTRPDDATWVEETSSLIRMNHLEGYHLETLDGAWGWLVYNVSRFQLSHFVMDAVQHSYHEIITSLLEYVHHHHNDKDTKIENVPIDHPALPIFRNTGYIEAFRRIEMILTP